MGESFTRTTPIRIYDRNEELKLILDPRGEIPYFDGWYTEQLNGSVSLEFSVPANHPRVAHIENDGRAVIRDQDGNLIEFIIRIPEDSHDASGSVKKVSCEGGDYELIDEWMAGYKANGVSLKTALEAVLSRTRWKVGIVDDFETRNVHIEPTTVKNAVHQLLELFGGERQFRVVENGNVISDRLIDVFRMRGANRGKRFEYGKDTQSIRRTIDSTGIKTALYGYGESGEDDAPRLTFASIAWSKANGDPVDKPIGQTWIGDPDALQKWGYNRGSRHRFGIYSGQESDPAELLMNTWRQLQSLKDAVYTYELKVALLEKLDGQAHERVRLGDVVHAIDDRIHPPIRFEASIIEHRQNLNDDQLDEITVGNFRTSFDVISRIESTASVVAASRGRWNAKATPSQAKILARQEAEKVVGEANEAIRAAQDQIDAAELRIQEAELDLGNLTNRLGSAEGSIDTLNLNLGETTDKLDQAVLDLQTAESDLDTAQNDLNALTIRLGTAESDIGSLSLDLSSAQTTIDGLKSDITEAQTRIDSLDTTFTDLQTRLGTAENSIGSLETNLGFAQDDIDDLQTDLGIAKSDIGSLESSLSEATPKINEAQEKINAVTSTDEITGETVLEGTLITNNIIAENATLTGTLLGSAATILDLETDRMIARDATIQNATISGTIGANAARFIEATIQDATITGTIGAAAATFIEATMRDAIVTGNLDAAAATFLSGTFQEATMISATIRDAIITGSIGASEATFVNATMQDATVTGTIGANAATFVNATIQDATITGSIGANAATFINATMQDAIVTGSLNASTATFNSGTFQTATIIDAIIRDATISGSIGAAAATFVEATMRDATVTGNLDANAATFLSGTFEAATIVDATIQNATITGTLNGVSGTFTGELNGASGFFSGDLVTYGEDPSFQHSTVVGDGKIEMSAFALVGEDNSYFAMQNYLSAQEFYYQGILNHESYIRLGDGYIDLIALKNNNYGVNEGYVKVNRLNVYEDAVFDTSTKFNEPISVTASGSNDMSYIDRLTVTTSMIADQDLNVFGTVHAGNLSAPDGNLTISDITSTGYINANYLQIYYAIRSQSQNNANILVDHRNGNISLSGAGTGLFLGYYNTTKLYFNAEMQIQHETIKTTKKEEGYCGVGGQNAYSGTGWNVAGVGVNFRIRKTYTPSSIDLTAFDSMSYNASAKVAQITSDGFWLYVQSQTTSTGGYWYWRGTYYA